MNIEGNGACEAFEAVELRVHDASGDVLVERIEAGDFVRVNGISRAVQKRENMSFESLRSAPAQRHFLAFVEGVFRRVGSKRGVAQLMVRLLYVEPIPNVHNAFGVTDVIVVESADVLVQRVGHVRDATGLLLTDGQRIDYALIDWNAKKPRAARAIKLTDCLDLLAVLHASQQQAVLSPKPLSSVSADSTYEQDEAHMAMVLVEEVEVPEQPTVGEFRDMLHALQGRAPSCVAIRTLLEAAYRGELGCVTRLEERYDDNKAHLTELAAALRQEHRNHTPQTFRQALTGQGFMEYTVDLCRGFQNLVVDIDAALASVDRAALENRVGEKKADEMLSTFFMPYVAYAAVRAEFIENDRRMQGAAYADEPEILQ